MNVSALLVPAAVCTVTLTRPEEWRGVRTVMRVLLPWDPPWSSSSLSSPELLITVAAVPPKNTRAPARFVPVSVTVVPPEVLPEDGLSAVRVGPPDGGGVGAA